MFSALIASLALATGPYVDPSIPIKTGGAAYTTIACNAPVTMDAIAVEGWRYITFKLTLSRAIATDVTMTCNHGDSTSTAVYQIPAEVWAGYTATSDAKVWQWLPSASESWSWTVNLWSYRYLACTFACAGANVNDKLTITAAPGVGE